MSEKTRAILAQLSLKEKCELCAQADGSFGRVERLGLAGNVPQDNPRDGQDYFRSGAPKEGDGLYHPVAFPSDACLAMGWDEELAYETGKYFALEGRANPKPVTWLFRPGVNIKRSPLCGRNFEYFSEDPHLAGELAGSYIQGLQDNGVAATLKHYICNNQEFERMTTNSLVSERALREIYLRAFEVAIKKGNPWSIMSSYNQVNGEWVNSNQHISDLLRKDLGYDGVVVSDFAAVHRTKVQAHQCGMMDIELAPTAVHSEELYQAVLDGKVSEADIDRGLERVFDLVDRLYATEVAEIDMADYHEKARESAEKCMVLLKNDGILPLSTDSDKLLIVGSLAEDPSYMGGGSGHMNGWKIDTYLEEIRKICPTADYAEGYPRQIGWPPVEEADPERIREALGKAEQADTIIVFAGLGYCYESEGYDRRSIQLPAGQKALLDVLAATDKKIILVLSAGSVLDISEWNDRVQAVLYNSLGGEAVASATANILFGKAEPGGRLAESWPVIEEHTPSYMNFARHVKEQPDVMYGEDIFVGYRWYQKRKLPVLYPFGHGLSYTQMEVGAAVLSEKRLAPTTILEVRVPVKNIGSRAGSQVIQVYVSQKESVMEQPVRELKGFAKVTLAPGEESEVSIRLDRAAFESFSSYQNKWIIEDGEYSIQIGLSADNILEEVPVWMEGGDVPFVYTEMTPLVWFIESEKYHRILQEEFPPELDQIMNQDTFEWCCLIAPMPFYKITEPFMGKPWVTREEMLHILDRMNQ